MKYTSTLCGTLACIPLLIASVCCIGQAHPGVETDSLAELKSDQNAPSQKDTRGETDEAITLPAEALNAFVNNDWVKGWYHDRPVRLYKGFVPDDASLHVDDKPVEIVAQAGKTVLQISQIEKVEMVEGYALAFEYPFEGVTGTIMLVPQGKEWKSIFINGAER